MASQVVKKLQKIVPIKKNHASNKMNFSSIVNEITRTIYLFFYEDILHKKSLQSTQAMLPHIFLYA